VNVVPFTAVVEFHGLDSVPDPLVEAAQST
jgi:hypothetical protein